MTISIVLIIRKFLYLSGVVSYNFVVLVAFGKIDCIKLTSYQGLNSESEI